jgi:hypothetical protein
MCVCHLQPNYRPSFHASYPMFGPSHPQKMCCFKTYVCCSKSPTVGSHHYSYVYSCLFLHLLKAATIFLWPPSWIISKSFIFVAFLPLLPLFPGWDLQSRGVAPSLRPGVSPRRRRARHGRRGASAGPRGERDAWPPGNHGRMDGYTWVKGG